MLLYDGMDNRPLRLANIHFLFAKITFVISFFLGGGYLSNFVECKMGFCEWMAWMWFAHDHKPFIHNASLTWANLCVQLGRLQLLYIDITQYPLLFINAIRTTMLCYFFIVIVIQRMKQSYELVWFEYSVWIKMQHVHKGGLKPSTLN